MRQTRNGSVSPKWPRMIFRFGCVVEHAGQHQADRLRRGLHRVAPARAHHQREVLGVVLVVDFRHLRMRQRGMEVDRHVELLGALVDRPVFLVVEEFAVGHAVQHGALEAELGDRALEFVGGGLRIDGGERREGGKALRVGRADLGQAVVDRARQVGRDLDRQLLGRGRAVREHLDVDAGLVHFLDAQGAQIVEPLVGLVAAARLPGR